MTPSTTVLIALVPLVIWRLYKRTRRFIARQKSRPWRHWAAVIFFPVLIALLALVARHDLLALGGLALGLAAGVVVGIYGLRLTRYESTPEGYFYTPNAYIGIVLSSLLIMRVLFRITQSYAGLGALEAGDAQQFGRSPLTLLIFGVLAGYYITYGAGLLRWRRTERVPAAQNR